MSLSLALLSIPCSADPIKCPNSNSYLSSASSPYLSFNFLTRSLVPNVEGTVFLASSGDSRTWNIRCQYGPDVVAVLNLPKDKYKCETAKDGVDCKAQ